jgi:hypothetical protein
MAKRIESATLKSTWGISWLALCVALALHVIDEAMTDFLSLWNPLVHSIRERFPWSPLPTFEYEIWLGGLIVAIAILFALSYFVFAGAQWMRPVAYFLSIVMLGNGLGHIGASVYLAGAAPGVTSSPILLAAAGFLLWATRRQASATPIPEPSYRNF